MNMRAGKRTLKEVINRPDDLIDNHYHMYLLPAAIKNDAVFPLMENTISYTLKYIDDEQAEEHAMRVWEWRESWK